MIRPYVLSENNWKDVQFTDYEVAILPWGATEAHNYHLPYATDNYQVTAVAEESARIAWGYDNKVIVLPTVPFGVNTGQMDIKLCLNIHPSTQLKILEDLVEVLAQQNIHKLCIMNGHGGNEFKTFIRELSVKFPQTFICTFNWWDAIDVEAFFQDPGDHAGELETSMMMNLKPNLVLLLTEAGDGISKSFKIKGMKEGWVKAQRKWSAVSKDTGVGNPKQATEAKGKDFFNAVTQEIGRFLSDLAETDLHDLYENN